MHELAPLIKDLAIILGVAGLAALLFQKIRQPIVLGYLIAGIIVGPYTPPNILIRDIPTIQTLSALGVIFLMFSLGLEFNFKKLKRVGFTAGIAGLFEVIFMLILGFFVGKLIGWSFYDSLFLAAALAISSTTIIIKALEDLHLKTTRFAEIVFGILVIEDILAILLLVALSTIITTHNIFSSEIAFATIKLILVVGAWFLFGYFFVVSFFRSIMHNSSNETLIILSVALCLALVWIANYFHYSSALGAFIMGSILAETSIISKIKELIEPIRNLFAAVFFVSVGMLIDPVIIWNHLGLVFIICLITIISKILTTGIGAFITGQSVNSSLRIGFSMAQIGEFSFVIISLGLALHAINNILYPIIVAVSAITTFTTPYLIKLSGYLGNKIDQHLSADTQRTLTLYSRWIKRLAKNSKKQSFYQKAFLRFIVNSIVVGIILMGMQTWGLNYLIKAINPDWLASAIAWLCAIILCLPSIFTMLQAFKAGLFFLAVFSWVATLTEIILLSLPYFYSWVIGLVLFSTAIVLLLIFARPLRQSAQWLEKKLVKNLNTKEQ